MYKSFPRLDFRILKHSLLLGRHPRWHGVASIVAGVAVGLAILCLGQAGKSSSALCQESDVLFASESGRCQETDDWRAPFIPDRYSVDGSEEREALFYRACIPHNRCYRTPGTSVNACDLDFLAGLERECKVAYTGAPYALARCYETVKQIFEAMVESPERNIAYQQAQATARIDLEGNIARIYQEMSGEVATPGIVSTYLAAAEQGWNLRRIREDIANRPEVKQAIARIYREVLERSPTETEEAIWIVSTIEGFTLERVRYEVAHSKEAAELINQIYREILDRDVDPAGLTTWTDALATDWTLEAVREAIATSEEAEAQRQKPKQ